MHGDPCLATRVRLAEDILLAEESVRREDDDFVHDRQAVQEFLQDFRVGRLQDVQQQGHGLSNAVNRLAPALLKAHVPQQPLHLLVRCLHGTGQLGTCLRCNAEALA